MTIEFRFILAALVCFRLGELIAIDFGPGNIFLRFRAWCKRKSENLFLLVSCPYCVGIYFAPILALLAVLAIPASDAILLILGIAGAQALMQGIAGRMTA